VVLIVAGIPRVIDAIWAFSYHGALPDGLQGALGHSLQTYGWIWLIIGVILIAAGALLFGPSDRPAAEISRWVGIIAASLGAISAMFVMPYYPVWSLLHIILAVMVVYGLVAGNRRQCVAFGLRTRQAHGVWGGMTEDEPGDGEGQQDRQEADLAGGDAGRPEEHDQDEYREQYPGQVTRRGLASAGRSGPSRSRFQSAGKCLLCPASARASLWRSRSSIPRRHTGSRPRRTERPGCIPLPAISMLTDTKGALRGAKSRLGRPTPCSRRPCSTAMT